jgi:DNA gyrase subunit B
VAAPDSYDETQIQVLEGLDPVRKRPGMYAGGTNARALHHLVWEVVDNAVDEALAGHCTEITVTLDADNVVTVIDNGRGIPVGIHRETGVSALELVFTRLHAGGKFGGGLYKVSGGLHGVGASVTNALSEWLEVEVRRDGYAWHQRYERGIKTCEVTKGRKLGRDERPGTTVRWHHDETIFDRGVHYSVSTIAARLKEKAYLVRGLEFRFRASGAEEEQVFRSEAGLADYVRELNAERQAMHPTVISLRGHGGDAELPVEVALQWTDGAEERIYSFCNVVNTVDGGTHVSGLRRALTRSLNNQAYETGRLKRDKGESLEARDVFDGLTAAVSVMVVEPQFEGQTKGRLNNSEAQSAVQSFVYETFSAWLAANPRETKQVLDRLLLTRDIRIAQSKISKKLRNAATSIFSDSNLPGKLADTLDNPNVPVLERELFIVEGDSAGGSAKQARDANLQAILPIRGKILNVFGAKPGRAFENAEVDAILVALGGRKDAIGKAIVATLESEQLRYGKIVLASDADADGAHIGNLLITLFHELFPRLLAEGRVFLADPPLYRVSLSDGTYVYVGTEDELRQTLKARRRSGEHVTRFKGLGEMNPDQLRETVFDPSSRRLLQVTFEDAVQVAETVKLLMGSDAQGRRGWLEEAAPDAEVDV